MVADPAPLVQLSRPARRATLRGMRRPYQPPRLELLGDDLPPAHGPRRRALALAVALVFILFAVLAAGYGIFGAPPTPERTRPLPPSIPAQGAIR